MSENNNLFLQLRRFDPTFLALIGLFLLPVKLALAYVFLIPAIAISILKYLLGSRYNQAETLSPLPALWTVYLLMLISFAISGLFGFNPSRSIVKLLPPLFYSWAIVLFRDTAKRFGYVTPLKFLVLGEALAGVNAVLNGAYPATIKRAMLGAVTESGQLSIGIFAALALTAIPSGKTIRCLPFCSRSHLKILSPYLLLGVLNFLGLCVLSFRTSLGIGYPLSLLILIACLGFSLCVVKSSCASLKLPANAPSPSLARLVVAVVLPLLIATLLVNLKRGPWMGVLVATLILFTLTQRKLFLPLVLSAAMIFFAFPPIRTRVQASAAHFFIAGGRSEIWSIGKELAPSYPLGIGFRNSPILREFSTDIPPELRHFHNNAINILVEGGYATLAIFLWWLFMIWSRCFNIRNDSVESFILRVLGCALVSWQVAGIVEYNFGDSEVVLIALAIVGIIDYIWSLEGNYGSAVESPTNGPPF